MFSFMRTRKNQPRRTRTLSANRPPPGSKRSPVQSRTSKKQSRVNLIDLHQTDAIVKQTNEFAEMTENTDISRLVIVHNLTAESILYELKQGNKEAHWAWWIFPSGRAGVSDPLKTRVTLKTYHQFLQNIQLPLWREILQLIAEHPDKMPPIDHGRIHHFCKFWKKPELTHIPDWLKEVIATLELYFS